MRPDDVDFVGAVHVVVAEGSLNTRYGGYPGECAGYMQPCTQVQSSASQLQKAKNCRHTPKRHCRARGIMMTYCYLYMRIP